jgi:hypothetical protein
MKSIITLEIPLSGTNETLTLPEPCTYCGAAVSAGDDLWERKISYDLVEFFHSPKYAGLPSRRLVINGQVQKGSVTLRAPYCAKHRKKVAHLKYLNTILTAVIMIAAFIFFVQMNRQNNGFSDSSFIEILLPLFGILVTACIVAMLINGLVNKLILMNNPGGKDYPTSGNGHWGLAFGDVRPEPSGPGSDGINYLLPIEFANRESALHFLNAYPRAVIVKGK